MYELTTQLSKSGKSKYFGFVLDGEFVKCASKKTALVLISKFNSLEDSKNDISSNLSEQSEQSSSPTYERELTETERSNQLLTGNPWGQPDPEVEELSRIAARGREARAAADEARARILSSVEEELSIISELSNLSELKLERFRSQAELHSSTDRARNQLDPETVDVAHQPIS